MKKIKIEINPTEFPDAIRHLIRGATVYDSSCSAKASVYYLDTGYYIKAAPLNSLTQEANLTRLFSAMGLGVEVMSYISSDRDYLITRSAEGEDLTHYLTDPEKLCKLLASALRRLHSQPICGVPVSSGYQRYMDSANGGFSGGSYDESVLMDPYRIQSKEEAWAMMQANKHLLSADTLIHGDPCLPNVIQKNGSFTSFIDFDMSGVGDKHIDLYWAIWSLQYNLKTNAYTDLFLDLYGRQNFNEDMLPVVAAFELFG